MAYVVDRVVICDAFREPDKHYQLRAGGRPTLVEGRRPSVRFLASARDAKGGIAGVVGKEASLFEDMLASSEQRNDFINQLRDEVRAWRKNGYAGTALVTRRLLEWWFERDEERAAIGRRFFFCQQEAIETVIYLYEVQSRRRVAETGDLLRYALKLATGTGKTVVMALLITWSTLHHRKVSGSSLSENFLVLVPNLTVRDRVTGAPPRGGGLDIAGERHLYNDFQMVPPEYQDEFRPNVMVRKSDIQRQAVYAPRAPRRSPGETRNNGDKPPFSKTTSYQRSDISGWTNSRAAGGPQYSIRSPEATRKEIVANDWVSARLCCATKVPPIETEKLGSLPVITIRA
jgi:Type III restriction enzyme, res subunit